MHFHFQALAVCPATYAKVFAVGSHKPSRLSEQANKAENFIKNGFRQEEQEQKAMWAGLPRPGQDPGAVSGGRGLKLANDLATNMTET